MGENNKTNELQHWGIKGMRWGIRRSKKQLGHDEPKGEKFLTSKKKSVSKMSDDELQKEINRRKLENDLQRQKNDELDIENKRLELEKKYSELNPEKLTMGQKMFNDIWPRAKKATLDAGETLLKDTLIAKGKELLGVDGKSSGIDYDKENKRMQYEDKVKLQKETGYYDKEYASNYSNKIKNLQDTINSYSKDRDKYKDQAEKSGKQNTELKNQNEQLKKEIEQLKKQNETKKEEKKEEKK